MCLKISRVSILLENFLVRYRWRWKKKRLRNLKEGKR
tara:strand:- start:259 stop:369 length:111 start_codon:yes stop_codon:yes gene_type:complete